jgi:bile acid transporter
MVDAFTLFAILLIVIIGLGLGATTTYDDFRMALSKPKAIGIGFTSQYCFMPLLAFALSQIFTLKESFAIGVILVGASPGGTTSNIFTYWGKGDLALSITMSFFSNCAAFFMLPLLILLLIKTALGASIQIPWANIFISLLLIVVPCLLGLSVRHYNTETKMFGKLIWEWMELLTTVVGFIFFLAALVSVLYIYHEDLRNAPWEMWLIASIMEPAGALFGYFFAKWVKLSRKDARTIGIETGVQSFTLTIAIITLSFDGDERDDALLFPILYGVMYIVNSVWIILFLRYYLAPLDEADESPDQNWGDGKTEEEQENVYNIEHGTNQNHTRDQAVVVSLEVSSTRSAAAV